MILKHNAKIISFQVFSYTIYLRCRDQNTIFLPATAVISNGFNLPTENFGSFTFSLDNGKLQHPWDPVLFARFLKMSHLKNVLDNCVKQEHREKQTLLLTHLEVLFDISAFVNSRTLDGPTVLPYIVVRFLID